MTDRFAFLDHPGPIAFAHRGGGRERPENTVAAFSHAVDDLGYRYLETDVHVTADGVVAVIHDPALDRTTDRSGRVAALSWAEVARARTIEGEAVPRLDDVLAAWPDVRWNIDAKHDAVVEPLAAAVRRAAAIDRVCVTSFSDRRLERIRGLLGLTCCTALGPLGITALRAASWVPRPVAPVLRRAGAAQVPRRQGLVPVADRRLVDRAHRLGLAVHVWTIDDAAAMEDLLDLGVDGIMTDCPTVLREVLERRGEWR